MQILGGNKVQNVPFEKVWAPMKAPFFLRVYLWAFLGKKKRENCVQQCDYVTFFVGGGQNFAGARLKKCIPCSSQLCILYTD